MTTTTKRLDHLTNALTAFRTWAEFAAAMSGGYVPTIRPTTKRHGELGRAARAAGFRVWGVDGRNWK